MPIVLRHFDVLTGEWIVLPNADPRTRSEKPEVFLEETLNDTLLEAFTRKQFLDLPLDDSFSVTKISTKLSPEDLLPSSHPRGHVLILTNGERAIYGPVEVRDYIHREINPDSLHNGAYGSLFIGDCKHSYSGKATYLVVDDKTGENGGILPNDLAYKLVGDSHGKVAAQFAQEKWSDTYSHLLQFRLGDLTEDVYAKGVLAPKRMEQYFGDNPLGQKVDFIIPTSSFKGKGKSTVKPGLYADRQIWIGEKDRSKAGTIRGSQLLEDHPTALWDLFPQMEVEREQLLETMKSPSVLAQYYCDQYEAHRQKLEPAWIVPTRSEASERYRTGREQRREYLEGDLAKEQVEYNEFLYHALKADPDFKMYGMPAFTRSLQDFFYQQFRDMGTGRILKFDRAMIMPSKGLIDGEIYNPNYDVGEQVIGFRSPVLNANGETLHVNQLVEDILDPDGNAYEGVIAVPDEDIQRILTRVSASVRQIEPNISLPDIPDEIANLSNTERMALIDRFNQATAPWRDQVPVVPYECISERWASDYDGDCIGTGRGEHFPNLARSVAIKQKPENMLPPVRKEAKQSFPEGTSFEAIAIHMADGISVGRINNVVTQIRALAAEQELYELMGTDAQKIYLATQLQAKARELLTERDSIPPSLVESFERIARGDLQNPQPILDQQRQIYREMTGIACYHNQVAVDLFKSARTPDLKAVLALSELIYRQPNYFRDKKQQATYRTRGLDVETAGASPVELLALYTNEFFDKIKLQTSPVVGYKDLLAHPFTQQQFLEVFQVKAQYDELHNLASQLDRQRKQEGASFIRVQLNGDRFLDVVQVQEIAGAQVAKDLSGQEITLKLVPTEGFKAKQYPNTVTYLKEGKWEKLGFLSEFTPVLEEKETFKGTAKYQNFLSEGQVKLLFEQADKLALDWRRGLDRECDAEEIEAYASATWSACFNKDAERFATNNFAFATFGDRVIDHLAKGATPVQSFLVGQLTTVNQVPEALWKTDEPKEWVVLPAENDANTLLWHLRDGDRVIPFGSLSNKTYQPPVGTVVQATIEGDIFSTARLDLGKVNPLLEGQEIIVGNMNKYAAVGREFKGEAAKLIFTTDIQPDPQPLLTVEGKPLGRLSPSAVQLFNEKGVYHHGFEFEAQLNVIGTGPSQRIILETSKGNLFQVEKSHFYGHPLLSDPTAARSVRVALDLNPPQNPALKVAMLDKEGSPTFIGEFTPNQKATKEALTKARLYRSGVIVDAEITSRVTAARLNVQSYQFPANSLSNSDITPTPNSFLKEFRYRPTVASLTSQTWQRVRPQTGFESDFVTLPTANVDLDVRRIEGFKKFLEARNIPYAVPGFVSCQSTSENEFKALSVLDDPEAIAWQNLATQLQSRGMARVQMVQSDVSDEVWRVIEQLAYRSVEMEADTSKMDSGDLTDSRLEESHFFPDNEKLLEVLVEIKPLTGVQRKLYQPFFDNLSPESSFPRRSLPTVVAPVPRPLPAPDKNGKPIYQDTLAIAVDLSKATAIGEWLQEKGVEAQHLTPESGLTPEESAIGYEVFSLTPDQWTEGVKADFAQAFPPRQLESNSAYFQWISQLDRDKPTLQFHEKPQINWGGKEKKPMQNNVSLDSSKITSSIQLESDRSPNRSPIITEVHGEGSCDVHTGLGQWRTRVVVDGTTYLLEGSEENTTAPRMQLTALLAGLTEIDDLALSDSETLARIQLTIFSKDQTLINQASGVWKIKLNRDLWAEYKSLSRSMGSITFKTQSKLASDRSPSPATSETRSKSNPKLSEPNVPKVPTDVKLTEQQETALDALTQWAQAESSVDITQNVFVLKGYAGTGKTFLVPQFIDTLKSHSSAVVCAPTHKAAGVIAQKMSEADIRSPISTIDSLLKIKPQYDLVTGRQQFQPTMPIEDMELPSFIVADESSMIDPLRLDYLLQAAAKGKKILLVGDPAQLPFVPDANGYDGLKFPYAIGNKVSPAFAHPLIQNQVELTDVVRYEGDLAKLAFQLRSQNHLYLQTSGDRSLEAQMSGDWLETLLEKFLSEEFERDPNYVRAIAFTNERVKEINQAVRQARYGNNPQRFERGELLIAKEPVKIDGGLEGLETSDEVIVRSENICLDDNGIKCRFLQVDMGDRPLNGEIKVVHEDAEAQLKVELNKLKTNAQKVQNPKAWSDYYRFKEQYANLEYGYALTIHKSQGSTFQYVGVDEANINNYCRRDPEMGRALKYTAITRASQQVLVTHERAPRRSLVSLPGEVPSTVSSLPQKPADIRELVPLAIANAKLEHNRQKDRVMAAMATQFIGFSSQSDPTVVSSTRDYQAAWGRYGLANTGQYSDKDTIMVSGSGLWRGVTPEAIALTFELEYQPLLYQAICAKSQFVIGTAQGMDQRVAHYLKDHGYQLTPHPHQDRILVADAPEMSIPHTAQLFSDYLDWQGKDRLEGTNFHVKREGNRLLVSSPSGEIKLSVVREQEKWKSTEFNFNARDFEVVSRFQSSFDQQIERCYQRAEEANAEANQAGIDEKDSKSYTLRLMEVWQRLGFSPEEMRQTLLVNNHFHRLTQGTHKWEMVGLSDPDAFDRQFNSYWEEVQFRMQPQQMSGKEKQIQV